MYFANMYCYGHDNNVVGITGIRGCMGVVYVGAASMYAVHIPHNSDDLNKLGGETFVGWVKNQETNLGKRSGYLFAFVNGKNRSDAKDEVSAIKKGLKSPPTTLYRILKHLGSNSGGFGADSVAIMVDRVHTSPLAPSGCLLYYKRNDDVTWIGGGSHESGQYKLDSRYQGDAVPSDVRGGWRRFNNDNCSSTPI